MGENDATKPRVVSQWERQNDLARQLLEFKAAQQWPVLHLMYSSERLNQREWESYFGFKLKVLIGRMNYAPVAKG